MEVWRTNSTLRYRYILNVSRWNGGSDDWKRELTYVTTALSWVVVDLEDVLGDPPAYFLETVTRKIAACVILVLSRDPELNSHSKKFGYVYLDLESPQLAIDHIKSRITEGFHHANMSGVIRSFMNRQRYIDVGGRDDYARMSPLVRSVNPNVPLPPLYDPKRLYPYVEIDDVKCSLGQSKLYYLLWVCLAAVGLECDLLYVGGSPGENVSWMSSYFKRIVIIDPRKPCLEEFEWINDYATPENFVSLLKSCRFKRTTPLMVLFDIRSDRGDLSDHEWSCQKLSDTIKMQKMADLSIENGAVLASIKFWVDGDVKFPPHPIFVPPFAGSWSHEMRTLQTKVLAPQFHNAENAVNYCRQCFVDRSSLANYDFVAEFYPFTVYRRRVQDITVVPQIVFEFDDFWVNRELPCKRRMFAPFVLNHLDAGDLALTLSNPNLEGFTLFNFFDTQSGLSAKDNDQQFSEVYHSTVLNYQYRLMSYGKFCEINECASDIYFDRDTESVAFYVRRKKFPLFQTYAVSETYLVKVYIGRLVMQLNAIGKDSIWPIRYECIRSHFPDAICDGGKGVVQIDGRDVTIDMSGHCLGMLIASHFGQCDIVDYLGQVSQNLVSVKKHARSSVILLEDRPVHVLWHRYFDYVVAVDVFLRLTPYGIAASPAFVAYVRARLDGMLGAHKWWVHG